MTIQEKIPPGYRTTEIGIVPMDWAIKPLPEALEFISGKAHEQHIKQYGKYVVVNSKFISSEAAVAKFSDRNFCPARQGDILMVMSDLPNGRAPAKCFLVDVDGLYAVNQRVCLLRPRSGDSHFFFYQLNRNPYFLSFDDGVQQTHLLNAVFRACPVIIPPLEEEQRAIAAALSDADELIASLDALIAKKHDLKQATMQELLTGKTHLPVVGRRHGYYHTEIGVFPNDWALHALGELFSFQNGVASRSVLEIDLARSPAG